MKIIKYFIQFVLIINLFFIFKIIGYKNASNFGYKIGKYFGKIIRSNKIILKNLTIIKNNSNIKIENESSIVDEVFGNYGRILSEYVYLNKFKNGTLNNFVNIHGSQHLEEIKSKNKKVIFVSGHFSNFELMAMYLEKSGVKLSAIYRPLNNFFLNQIMETLRKKYICKNQIKKGIGGLKKLIELKKNNSSTALMIDQRVSEGIQSNFFNKKALTTKIPAQLVKRFDIPIVPVYIERIKGINFKIYISPPINFSKNSTIQSITDELNLILEKMVTRKPEQWIWSHNRWK